MVTNSVVLNFSIERFKKGLKQPEDFHLVDLYFSIERFKKGLKPSYT